MTATQAAPTGTGRRHARRTLSPQLRDLRPDGVQASLDWLSTKIIRNVTQALAILYYAHSQAHILKLYGEYFPAEYAASRARAWPDAREISRHQTEFGNHTLPHSPRELEFFNLVDKRLFNYNVDIVDFIGRLDFIPLCLGNESVYEHEPSGFRISLQLAGALLSGQQWITVSEVLHHLTDQCTKTLPEPLTGRLDWRDLEAVFLSEDEPLRFFMRAAEVVDKSTGNAFLDHICDQGDCMEFAWSRDSIETLKAEYAETERIMDRVAQLDDWIAAAPKKRLSQIVRLWNRAIRAAQGNAAGRPKRR